MSLASLPLHPETCRYLGYLLRSALPLVADDMVCAEAARDQFACDSVLALRPATEAEAILAIAHVANQLQAMDAFRLVGVAGDNVRQAMQSRAQGASMFRHADAALRALERKQGERQQSASALPAPVPVAALPVGTLPVGTLAVAPVAVMSAPAASFAAASIAVAPPPVGPLPTGPAAAQPSAVAQPAVSPATEQPEMTPQQALAAAERFAKDYPRRATLLRRFGRTTVDANFVAPNAAVVRALVTGMTPALRKLDRRAA